MSLLTKTTDPVHPICWPFPTFKGKPYKPPKDHKKQRQDRMLAKAEPALFVNKQHLTKETIMRCVCCDKNLNDYESTRKHAITGDYLDTCNGCLAEINELVAIPCITREDLANCGDIVDYVDNPDTEDYNDLYREDTKE